MLGDPEYTIGNLVQIARYGRGHLVVWRGRMELEEEGMQVRRWVYLLDNGHWDCYHEDELQPFGRWYDPMDGRS